ncbi:MAG: hypothetical protein L3J53_00840 [Proteobacteria bacterium]|nr:hypothetical protein [Pseudomonadota bacterium]
MSYEEDKVSKSIADALSALDMKPEIINDAVFHMTDWLDDLKEWHSFCEKPESLSNEELQDLLMGFLVHVPAHVAAASKLITGLPVKDVFGVGATSIGSDE